MIQKHNLSLFLFLSLSYLGFAQYTGSGTFTKINSLAELTDGYYVITNEADAVLMTNGRSGTATTGYFISAGITPVLGTITNPATSNVWLIETNGAGRTIYNEDIARYVGWSSGNAASIEVAPANTNRWTFSYAGGKFTVLNVATTTRQLSYNAGAPRFAAYVNNGQQELQFYKLAVSSPPTITSFTPSNACPGTSITITGTNLTNATVTIGGVAVTKTANTATSITVTSGTSSGVIQVTTATGSVNSATNFTANAVPATPTNSFSAAPSYTSCDPVTLSYTGTVPVNTIYYWQTAANGESTTSPVSTPQAITVTGYRWVRALNASGCWSAAVQSPQVAIQTSAIINTQPQDISVNSGSNATFTVVSSNGTDYQWQQRIGAGVWTDLGTNSNTLTITNVPLLYDGYQYRVIVSNDCGSVISNSATLTVSDTCAEENFSNITSSTSSYNNETWNGTDGVTWNATGVRTDQTLTGKAVCFGTSGTRNVTSPTYSGGIGVLKFNYVRGFTNGNARTLQVWVNGVPQGGNITVSTTSDVAVQYQQAINIAGNVQLQIRSTGSGQVIIDDIEWSCYNPCTPAVISSSPTSGPEGTIVTITGTNFFAGSTVSFNGTPASSVTYINATTLEAVVPNGAATGNITVDTSLDCDSNLPFTIIDNTSSSCEGTSNFTSDLVIYEIYDENPGNGGMITIFNGTNTTKDLDNYLISRTTDHTNLVAEPYVVDWFEPTGMLAPGQIYRLKISTSVCSDTYYQLPYSSIFGTGFNARDGVQLRQSNGVTVVDELHTPNYAGYYMKRKIDFMQPNTTHNNSDWDIVTLTSAECRIVGVAPVLDTNSTPPTVSTLMAPTSDCNLSATLTITGTEGFAGGNALAYQWYYSAPGDLGWTPVPDNAIYDGVNTDTLDILNTLTLDGYQYYCQVREDDATCYTASNAIKLNVDATIWTAGAWSDGLPNINRIAIIDANYNTSAGGQQISFSACNLLVRTGRLTIANNTYVEVENNVTVESEIYVNERGSFKQNNNNGDVIVSGTVLVRKETAPMNNWFEYTYWSSPVAGEIIGTALSDATPSRRFWFNAQNFLDETAETGNNNATVDGQDDIDDDANDWTLAAAGDIMIPGRGYASTHRSNIFNSTPGPLPHQFVYTFNGPFNNGIYNVPIYRNDFETQDINWNFIGNPYPSAISADLFLALNTLIDVNVPTPSRIDGAIYLWSQNTAPADNANGNEVLNFAQADYAIINGTAQSAGGDGVLPTRFIPSGQGFFVSLSDAAATTVVSGTVRTADVVFNNQMRVTGNNAQFFRTSQELQPNKLWVNLTSDNGVFNQIAVGYVDGATDAFDGMYYDAPRNLSTEANSILYTIIPDSDKKFAIQGKEPNSLTLDEVIPLGFYTSIEDATIYKLSIAQFEGEFFNSQTVYVKDNLLNLYHDLSASDYPFTSETGEFNERFEIVFQTQTLGVGEVDVQTNDVSIIELNNGNVKFTVGHNLTIQSVEIYDMLGRQLYNLLGSNATEVYNLNRLSQAAYIAKVTLSNGQTLTKRAVKRH